MSDSNRFNAQIQAQIHAHRAFLQAQINAHVLASAGLQAVVPAAGSAPRAPMGPPPQQARFAPVQILQQPNPSRRRRGEPDDVAQAKRSRVMAPSEKPSGAQAAPPDDKRPGEPQTQGNPMADGKVMLNHKESRYPQFMGDFVLVDAVRGLLARGRFPAASAAYYRLFLQRLAALDTEGAKAAIIEARSAVPGGVCSYEWNVLDQIYIRTVASEEWRSPTLIKKLLEPPPSPAATVPAQPHIPA